MRRSIHQITLLLGLLFLLAGCGPTNVVVTGEFPEPLTKEIPLNAGLIFTPEFREYVFKEDTGAGLSVAIGKTQTALFRDVLRGMFTSTTEFSSLEESKNNHQDLSIIPLVEEIQVAQPRDTQLEIYEFWIRYNIQVFDTSGEPLADWVMTSYGKTMDQSHSSKESAIAQAALVALRDTGAQLVTRFHRVPDIKAWLQERLAAKKGEVPL